MALEPGGYADKLGNRYEGRWVVRQLLSVLSETIRSVVVEAIGDDQEGVDLCLVLRDDVHRAQQCKLRNLSRDRWTIADLARRDILAAMKLFLDRNETNEFSFVTAIPSTLLHDLCESARMSAGDPESFYAHQVVNVGSDRRRTFADFCQRLALNVDKPADLAKALSYLRRLFIELWPDNTTTRDNLLQQAATLINGDPFTVIAVLADFAQANLRQALDAVAIWNVLQSRGLHPRRLDNDGRVLPAVQELQRRFKDSIQPDLIANELIHRDETDRLVAALNEQAIVVLHGVPGQGKSGVLYELVERLERAGNPYLPIRLDRNEPRFTPQHFGNELGLPESPARCLNSLVNDRPGVLILDQLDAVRWTSRHSLNALDVCKALVQEIRSLRDLGRQVSVVLACRTYDLQNDPQIKLWLQLERQIGESMVEIGVLPLAPETVKRVASGIGYNTAQLSDRQISILQLPQHLAMWVRIVTARGAFEFHTRLQLMREFWLDRMRELGTRGVSTDSVRSFLAAIVGYMERNATVAAPTGIVDDPTVLDALCASGLVRLDGAQLTFSHQSYLDFQIASAVTRDIYVSNRSVCDWLGAGQHQTLFRREQLRQALGLLNDQSPTHFLDSIKAVLTASDVRFHLKHLCLEVLGQVDAPSDGLAAFLCGLAQEEAWKEHILGTVYFRHVPWVKRLVDDGTIGGWLTSDSWRNVGLWMLRGVAESIPDDVARTLRPHLSSDDQWNDRLLATIPWHAEADSAEMFDLRLELARLGVFRDHVNWAKLEGARSLELLAAIVSSWEAGDLIEADHRGGRRSTVESWSSEEAAALTAAIRANPSRAWELLSPHVCRLAPVVDEPYGTLQRWIDGDRFASRYGMDSIPHALVNLIIECGKSLARSDSAGYWDRTKEMRDNPSPVLQYILVETFASLSAEYANAGIEWLLADLDRLSIGTGESEPEWAAATRLITSLSPHCSDVVFEELERTLVHFHASDELQNASYWLATWKQGCFGDYWGRAQHFLLPGLDVKRRSKESNGLIGVLDRKYESYSPKSFLRRSMSKGGSVGSTLNPSLERISDIAWLHIVGNTDLAYDRGAIQHWHDDCVKESSVRLFSQDLSRIAKRFPERVGRLALKFPAEVAPAYRAAVLDGLACITAKEVPDNEKLAWQPAPVDLIEEVLARFPRDLSRAYAISFCWLLYHRAEDKWSDTALAQLADHACNHDDPGENGLVVSNEGGGFDASRASVATLETNLLNSVRSVAGIAIGEQLRNHPELVDRFRSVLEHLCSDPHPAVRIAGVEACLAILNSDTDFAIRCFCTAASGDIRVAASRFADYFFNIGLEDHFDQLGPLIIQMAASDRDDVAREGAAELAARWIFHDHFATEVDCCLDGSVPQRLGIAQIAASLVRKSEYFDKCSKLIGRLQGDGSADVRRALQLLVRSVDVLSVPGGIGLVKTFVQSQAFRDDPSPLVFTLSEHTGSITPFADVLFEVAAQVVGPMREATQDSARGTMHDLSEVLPMLLRLYEEAQKHQNTDVTAKCLDTFDLMFERRLGIVAEITQIVG